MKVSMLRHMLDQFDEDFEVGVLIDFPDFKNWSVLTYDIVIEVCKEGGGPLLGAAVYLSDFDYPAINRELKDLVEAIPEHSCTPK